MKLAPPIGQTFPENRDIVIKPLVRIAARTGAEQTGRRVRADRRLEGSAKAP
jgi:hypothetical protein